MKSVEPAKVDTDRTRVVFSVIVLAQFCGTSLWFAGNAIVLSLQEIFRWPEGSTGHLTTAVQAGFITGTLVVTLTGISDRYSPSRLFFISCIGGAFANSIPLLDIGSFPLCFVSRVLTGAFLGGIYPVGMKIAADWREHGLGDWLGALVGALVIGTALPHALRTMDALRDPAFLLPVVSAIALAGGLAVVMLVPDGPYRKKSSRFSFRHITRVLKFPSFRAPLLGYFGHMWELYTFWALVPWILARYIELNKQENVSVSLLSFLVMAAGGLGCWTGGKISLTTGSGIVARTALFVSGVCCILSLFMWNATFPAFLIFLLIWGFTVVADSPQFSALIAGNAPPETRGTAITFATCVGFTITIVSIQLLQTIADRINADYLLWMLAPGPLAGLIFSRK